jgi:hypothetical protein
MLVEFEDPLAVSPDALEHAVAVKQSMVEYRDLGLAARDIFSVKID